MSDPAALIGPPPQPVEHYGRYHLFECIGKGGMAEVFRALAVGVEGFRRIFVIKRIRAEKSGSPEFIQMFCEEARLSALLEHPNIVQVYDFGQIDGSYFLAMEYLRGKDLSSVMRALRLANLAMPPALAVAIAQQVAAGLHYAHTLSDSAGQSIQIIHRDVTPSNIMLLRSGGVKVLDFGIAKATSAGEVAETTSGRVKGKLAYLSPEQVRCAPLDGRADVFSLGVVLWEMLTGERLFSSFNEFHTMRNVLTQAIPTPSSKRPGVPLALDAVVAKALERDREQRYYSAQAMIDDLDRIAEFERCSGHAIPNLLHELFGAEATEVTPAIADLALAAPIAVTSVEVVLEEEEILEIEPDPSSATKTSIALTNPSRDPSRLGWRLLAAGMASVMLLAGLGWVAWQSSHSAVAIEPGLMDAEVSVNELPVPTPATYTIPPATPNLETEGTSPSPPSDTDYKTTAALRVPQNARHLESQRARPVRRREVRALSTEVTIDPFRSGP